jgi:hypothetical protein
MNKFITVLTTVSKYIESATNYLKLFGVFTRTLEAFNKDLKETFPDGFTQQPHSIEVEGTTEQQPV